MSTPMRRAGWIAAGIVAAVQSAALLWMAGDRIALLKSGREMLVEVIPVDPRDLFRGDYVILGYNFSGTGDMALPAGTKRGDRVFATLKLSEGSKWDLVNVATRYPDQIQAGEAVLNGIASDVWHNAEKKIDYGRIRYGIETYFVPEGTGRAIENMVRDKKIEAVLAVGSSGQAAIKALVIDGKRIHEEELF